MSQKFATSRRLDLGIYLWIARTREVRACYMLSKNTSPIAILARFMPNPLSTGHLHLSFPTHPPPNSHIPLSLLRPSHFPLAVIGIASCAPEDTLPSVLAQFHGTLLDLFPAEFVFPLARSCFVFEEGDGNNSTNLGDSLPGLAVIPSMMGNKKIYLGTLIADLCSNVLGEFGVLVCLNIFRCRVSLTERHRFKLSKVHWEMNISTHHSYRSSLRYLNSPRL